MSQQELELPQGWADTTIGSIAKIIHYGYTATSTKEDTGTKYLRITDIQNNHVNWNDVPFCKIPKERRNNYLLNENDIVFARTGGTVGKSFLIKQDVPSVVFASYLIRIVLTEQTDPHFIHYFFQSGDYWQQIQLGKTGLKTNVNAQILSKLMFLLPPLNEQKRIVSKIEELFSNIDSVKQSLELTKLKLELYKNSLLKSAFKERHSEWKDVKFAKITDLISGKAFKKSEYSETGIRLFQIANVSFGKTLWNDIVFMPPEYIDKYPHLSLKEDDLLMALNRPFQGNKLKVTLLKKEDTPSILYQRVGKFDLNNDVNHLFFFFYLQSPLFIIPFQKLLKGVDQPFVNKSELLKLDFSYPSNEEQEQIVLQIEQGFSLIENTTQIVNSTLQQLQTMKMSILKQTFEGKLVPQDPNDEPASVLLERIKNIKESQSTKERRIKNVKK